MMSSDRREEIRGEIQREEVLKLTAGKERREEGVPCLSRHTWQRGVHDREHQGTGTEGLPAHVGKDRNTEAAQDETGIEDTAQGLERE